MSKAVYISTMGNQSGKSIITQLRRHLTPPTAYKNQLTDHLGNVRAVIMK